MDCDLLQRRSRFSDGTEEAGRQGRTFLGSGPSTDVHEFPSPAAGNVPREYPNGPCDKKGVVGELVLIQPSSLRIGLRPAASPAIQVSLGTAGSQALRSGRRLAFPETAVEAFACQLQRQVLGLGQSQPQLIGLIAASSAAEPLPVLAEIREAAFCSECGKGENGGVHRQLCATKWLPDHRLAFAWLRRLGCQGMHRSANLFC